MIESPVTHSYKTIALLALVVIAISAGVVWYMANHSVREETREIFTNTTAAATYIDLEGKPLSLEDFLGDVLVVASWASWSPFSATDLSNLSALSGEYTESGVTFVALNRKETKEQAARYLATIPALTGIVIAIDTEDRFYQSVGGYAMPETVIFNTTGDIVFHARGVVSVPDIKAVLDQEISS
jgi:thiol-disulfide isomerase/thioredoxin